MPSAPLRPCATYRCPNLVPKGYCDNCKPLVSKPRATAAQRGYGSRWQRERLVFLRENPLCIDCKAEHRLTPATDVDHNIPHKGNMELFWDRSNWRARCHSHHSAKTARENGGFGNATQ